MQLDRDIQRETITRIVFILAMIIPTFGKSQHLDNGKENFYERKVVQEQKLANPLHVRESDVVWSTFIWSTIDLRIKFNQPFYYPTNEEGEHGRKNLAYTLWDAIKNEEIPIYEDDECKIPIDNQMFVTKMTKGDTIRLQVEDENENYEYQTIVVPKEFSSEQIVQIYLKEAWYIDKQSTQMWVRPLALALGMNEFKDHSNDHRYDDDEEDEIDEEDDSEFLGTRILFWTPMQCPRVRVLLSQHEAMNERNIAKMPTWLYIIEGRYFESYITRESNRFNRTISSYLIGEDAILESMRIEDKLLNISSDIWEY